MAKKVGVTWILNMFVTIGRILWNAISLVRYVFKGISVIFNTVWSILKPVYEVIKGLWDVIYGFYTKYIKPALDWVEGKITWLTNFIDSIYNTLLGRIDQIYNETFGWYERLRDNLDDLTGKISRVVAVFDSKLAENIKSTEQKLFAYVDKYTRDVRDWVVEYVRDVYLDVRTELYEVKGAIDIVLGPVKEFVDAMKELIPPTIEKPALLSRETMKNSGALYGQDMFDGYFEATTPPLTPEEEAPITREVLTEWEAKHMNYIALGPLGPWADLHKFLAEEIIEITTGKEVRPRTEVVTPGPEEVE